MLSSLPCSSEGVPLALLLFCLQEYSQCLPLCSCVLTKSSNLCHPCTSGGTECVLLLSWLQSRITCAHLTILLWHVKLACCLVAFIVPHVSGRSMPHWQVEALSVCYFIELSFSIYPCTPHNPPFALQKLHYEKGQELVNSCQHKSGRHYKPCTLLFNEWCCWFLLWCVAVSLHKVACCLYGACRCSCMVLIWAASPSG